MTDGRQRRRLTATVTDLEVQRQRALVVGVALPQHDQGWAERSLEELELLTETAGSEPVDAVLLNRKAPEPATFIGSGQLDELVGLSKALDIDVVVFDNDLTPTQQRNLQKKFKCDVVDRVAVILDIFAQHATSREGMLQVELALLQYHLPRLRGKGTELSRLGGGIGTRGPGETKLETDRRRIGGRIAKLRKDLTTLERTRATQSKQRRRSKLPLVALVGYTNAGKSSLMNRLTEADVLERDQLFSTLGSTVRKLNLPSGTEILLSDTVGFVQRLPHELVEAFRSTLDQIADADLILHVVDASDSDVETRIAAVREVLSQIDGAVDIPEVVVFNKQDLADEVALGRLQRLHPEAETVSARTGHRTAALLERITDELTADAIEATLRVPWDRGDVIAHLRGASAIVKEEPFDSAMVITTRIDRDALRRFEEFVESA
ncbi:MAG: GTPase HflX [Acidimicrobiia bacterium]|nr:MAG: GTPase HflX [Acidimicrobiia bacterium]